MPNIDFTGSPVQNTDTPAVPGRGNVIGEQQIKDAADTLQKYKSSKAHLDERIVDEEQWYRLRHWQLIRSKRDREDSDAGANRPEPTSAWLFNDIWNKHADAMDNFPKPIVLPRERSDEKSAEVLSQILPVILNNSRYRKTYSRVWDDKLKHGTAFYGVFWDQHKDILGDVVIKRINPLNIFWEPGCDDIQESRNLFIVDLCDNDIIEAQYPQVKGKLSSGVIDVKQYVHEDNIDTSEKSLVVDWYYKKNVGGKMILHYCKFVGSTLLYASENDPNYADRGFYDHGKYPVVPDILFSDEDTVAGFGLIALCKDPQIYIDKLDQCFIESAFEVVRKRHFVSDSANVNEDELLDYTRPVVHVAGQIDESRVREITPKPLDGIYVNLREMKINEMKETASNRDVNSGGTSGATAASAIAAQLEAGNKTSREMISASYDAQEEVFSLVIELIRQFYTETRVFRITNDFSGMMPSNEPYSYVQFNSDMINGKMTGINSMMEDTIRVPVFDLEIKAQKKDPFSQIAENERAMNLYAAGFFNPEMADQAMIALEMMNFEGKDKIVARIAQNQQLLKMVEQYSALLNQLMGTPEPQAEPQPAGGQQMRKPETPLTDNIDEAQNAAAQSAPLAQRYANKAKVSMNG